MENFTNLQTWAVEQWGDVELGDSRRTQRAIAANPQASLSDIMQGWNEIRAAYRLFVEEDVKHEALIEPHIAATLDKATNNNNKRECCVIHPRYIPHSAPQLSRWGNY